MSRRAFDIDVGVAGFKRENEEDRDPVTRRNGLPVATAAAPFAPDLRVITSADGLDALADPWKRLHDHAGISVFQSWEWQRTWWATVGAPDRNRTLHVVVLETGGRVRGIAPLLIERVPVLPATTLRRLCFVGTGLTDYLDLLVENRLEEAFCDLLAAHLAGPGGAECDVVSLSDVPDRSPTRAPLLAALQRHGFETSMFVSEQCPRTPLSASWKETLESFDGKYRRKLSSRMRHMKERFEVALELCASEADVAGDIDEFMAMHQVRWRGIGKKGVYADEVVARFQREIARVFFSRGWLWLAFLRVDGRRIASILAFLHRGELAHYLSGLADPGEAARYSPGTTLSYLSMEAVIPRGVRVYDFLRGTEPYKYERGAADVPNWTTVAFPPGSLLAKQRHWLRLLREALAWRAEQEHIAFRHEASSHGLFSAAMAAHVGRRLLATFQDGVRKLRRMSRQLRTNRPPSGD